jgi:hypothetical protein
MKSVLRQCSGQCVAVVVLLAIGSALLAPWARGADRVGPHGSVYTVDNESGMARTINVAGFPVEAEGNPFFLDLGVNGRRCVTCHQPDNNMGISAAGVQERFEETSGRDPIFRPNDGSNSPLADVSTVEARRAAYSMLLTKGVIRVGIPIPANAEFELVSAAVMWDGRETLQKGSSAAIHFDLADQANAATQGHAQARNPINEKTRDAIFAYETTLYTS